MTSTEGSSALLIRPGTPEDAESLATLYLAARRAAVPAIPPLVHSEEEVRAWVRSWEELSGHETWVATDGSRPVGLLLLVEDWLHSLYVHPEHTGRGVGAVLLDLAKARRRTGFGLWVFESNQGARRFYLRHGLGVVRRTDGRDNEEGAPDLELRWPAPAETPRPDPAPAALRTLRGEVDEVDTEIARLLERRAGLVAAIQPLKPVPGHGGRDRSREAEIARRAAKEAPLLGAERVARIMGAVIAACLDAYETPDPSQGSDHRPDRASPSPDREDHDGPATPS